MIPVSSLFLNDDSDPKEFSKAWLAVVKFVYKW